MSESDRDRDHVSQSLVPAAAGRQAAAAPGAAEPGGGGRDEPEPGDRRRLQPRLELPQLRLAAVQPGKWAGEQRGRGRGQPQLLPQPRPQRGERRQLRQRPQREPQQQRRGRDRAAVRHPEQPQAGLDSAHHSGGEALLLQVSSFSFFL